MRSIYRLYHLAVLLICLHGQAVFADSAEEFELTTFATRDSLVDVHCSACEGFEARRLEVLTESDGTLTALRFFKIRSGLVTDTIGPRRFKESLVPMYEQSGFTVMELDARLVNPEKGGAATLIWYGNVLTKAGRGTLVLDLKKDEAGDWALYVGNRKINQFLITPGKFGVKSLTYR
jgi:hypothetical protein